MSSKDTHPSGGKPMRYARVCNERCQIGAKSRTTTLLVAAVRASPRRRCCCARARCLVHRGRGGGEVLLLGRDGGQPSPSWPCRHPGAPSAHPAWVPSSGNRLPLDQAGPDLTGPMTSLPYALFNREEEQVMAARTPPPPTTHPFMSAPNVTRREIEGDGYVCRWKARVVSNWYVAHSQRAQ